MRNSRQRSESRDRHVKREKSIRSHEDRRVGLSEVSKSPGTRSGKVHCGEGRRAGQSQSQLEKHLRVLTWSVRTVVAAQSSRIPRIRPERVQGLKPVRARVAQAAHAAIRPRARHDESVSGEAGQPNCRYEARGSHALEIACVMQAHVYYSAPRRARCVRDHGQNQEAEMREIGRQLRYVQDKCGDAGICVRWYVFCWGNLLVYYSAAQRAPQARRFACSCSPAAARGVGSGVTVSESVFK